MTSALVGSLFLGASLVFGSGAARAADPSAEYARQVSSAQVRLAQLEALLVESELRIEQLEEVIRQQGRNEQNRLENLDQVNAEVSRLRGAIEVLQFEMSESKRTLQELQIESERRLLHGEMRLAQVEKLLGAKPPPLPTDEDLGLSPDTQADSEPAADPRVGSTEATDQEEAPAPEVPDSASEILELAIDHMRESRQTVARQLLRAALQQHAGAPETAEIRYRLAETYFNEEDYRAAISEFNKVVNNHPESDWKCWSFYRMGEAFELLGKPDGAPAFYKGATERNCRSSDAAKKAREKL